MSIQTTTHLNFRGDARAALGFYQSVFGGDQMLISYADAQNVQHPSEADQIMWGQVVSESGFRIMAYDVPVGTTYDAGDIPLFVSVRGEDAAEITRYWEKLVEGSTIVRPLGQAPWAVLYGMLKDGFGVTWVVDAIAPNVPS